MYANILLLITYERNIIISNKSYRLLQKETAMHEANWLEPCCPFSDLGDLLLRSGI